MSEPETQRMTVGGYTFDVKFVGPYSHQGETLWLGKTVIARGEDDRTIAGDALIGSSGDQAAALNGTGGTPDEAYHGLEEKLAKLESRES